VQYDVLDMAKFSVTSNTTISLAVGY